MGEHGRTEGTVDEVKGNVKSTVGRATGDKRTEGEGKLDEAKGAVERGAEDVKDKVEDIGRDIKDRF
jgi:uncharacterized protein YjbJ (UPF0337 family)